MPLLRLQNTAGEALIDALDDRIGTSGYIVLYTGAPGDDGDPAAIPAGTEVTYAALDGTAALQAGNTQGSLNARTARAVFNTVGASNTISGGPHTVASFAIYRAVTTPGTDFTAANMVLKGDVSTVAAGTGALQLSSVSLSAGDSVDLTEASSYLELPLNYSA